MTQLSLPPMASPASSDHGSIQMIDIQLTAMQLPKANPIPKDSRWGEELGDGANRCQLRLSPGEPSELVVQIRNCHNTALSIGVAIAGNFPTDWLQIDPPILTIGNGHQQTTSVYFNLDPDFFEERLALRPGQVNVLDYSGQVNIYASASHSIPSSSAPDTPLPPQRPVPSEPRQILAVADFTLHVRPHDRYPRYLPAVYQDVDFLNRFLAVFEQSFDPAAQTLRLLWAYLDPLTAPEAMLPFLAQWVGWPSDSSWSIPQQRRMIRYALSIYRWRGTRWGLLLSLHLYTDLPVWMGDIPLEERHLIDPNQCEPTDCPEESRHIRVDEDSVDGFVVGTTDIGQEAMLGGGRPYHFTVRLRSPTRLDDQIIRRLINDEKPAFCSYDLHIVYYDRNVH